MLQRYLTSKQLHLHAQPTPKSPHRPPPKISRFVDPKTVKKHSSLSELERAGEEGGGGKGTGVGEWAFMRSSGVKKDEMFVIVKSKTFQFAPQESLRRQKRTVEGRSPLQTVGQRSVGEKATSTPEKRRYQQHRQLLLMVEFEKRYREELERKFLHRRLNLQNGLTATRLKIL